MDDELVAQLVARAQADGLRLTGEGGLLQQLPGVGGALGPDPVQTAAGVAALAVAAAGGTWLLHRRARGDGI